MGNLLVCYLKMSVAWSQETVFAMVSTAIIITLSWAFKSPGMSSYVTPSLPPLYAWKSQQGFLHRQLCGGIAQHTQCRVQWLGVPRDQHRSGRFCPLATPAESLSPILPWNTLIYKLIIFLSHIMVNTLLFPNFCCIF